MSLQFKRFATTNNNGGYNFDGDEKEDSLLFTRSVYDCYQILGLAQNSSLDSIKKNYRKLAK